MKWLNSSFCLAIAITILTGCSDAPPTTPDSTFKTPVDISFPLVIGTTWTYRYASRDYGPSQITETVGLHTWRVQSAAPGPNSTVYVISDSKRDTLTWVFPAQTGSLDTSTTTFNIVQNTDSIYIFTSDVEGEDLMLPRRLQGTNDTLRISYRYVSADYVRGVGLCRCSAGVVVGHYGGSASLTLISMSKP